MYGVTQSSQKLGFNKNQEERHPGDKLIIKVSRNDGTAHEELFVQTKDLFQHRLVAFLVY